MKRLLAVILTLALAASASACGKGGGDKPAPEPTGSAGPVAPVQVTIGLWGLGMPEEGKPSGKLRDYFRDVYGVEFVPWLVSEQDSKEKLASAIAAKALPDMFTHGAFDDALSLKQLIEGQLIRSIPETLYRNYHFLGTVLYRYRSTESIDEAMWFVPRADMSARYDNGGSAAIWYRLDWALKSGALTAGQAPSWKEFIDLSAYYARSDLDEDGCDDTWALTASGAGLGGLNTVFFTTFGVRDWVLEDGAWIPGLLSERAKEAVKWANQEFRNGHIDPEFSGQSEEAALEKFCSGKAGMLVADCSPAGAARMASVLQMKSPGLDVRKAVSVLPQPANPWGTAYSEDISYRTGVLFGASVDDVKLDRVLKLMDFLMSPDGLTMVNWGEQGVDYNVTGDGLQTLHRDDTGMPVTFAQTNPEWAAMAALATWGKDFMPAASSEDYRWKYLDNLKNTWWANRWRKPMFTRYILDPVVQGFDSEGKMEAALVELIMRSPDVEKDWQLYVDRMKQQLNVDAAAAVVSEYAQDHNIIAEE